MLEKLSKNRKIAVFAIILIAGLALRLSFIDRTDITSDEAFYAKFAYKIAQAMLANLPFVLAGIIAAGAVLYLALVKKSWKILAAVFAALLAIKFAFSIPYLFYTPEFFIVLQSIVIAISGIKPNIAGELISTFSFIGIAACAYFLGKELNNERAGFYAFLLLLFSPFGIFMGASSFRDPLGIFLAVLSLTLFIKSFKDKRLLPLSGIFLALALATRETILLFVPVFLAIAFWKRREILKNERRNELLVFAAITLFALAYYLPLSIGSANTVGSFIQRYGNTVNDLVELHYGSFFFDSIGGIARAPDILFYARAASLFYTPLILLAAVFGIFLMLKQRKIEELGIAFLLVSFFVWFSALHGIQRLNYISEMEFPLLFAAAVFFASFKKSKLGEIAVVAVLALFIAQSAAIIQQSNFNGFSQEIAKIPEGKAVLTTESDVPAYYRGIYVFDTELTNSFFKRFLPANPEKQAIYLQKRKLILDTDKNNPAESIDYAITREKISSLGYDESQFKLCKEIKSGKETVFWSYAQGENKCV